MTEKILYGRKINAPEYMEEILSSQPENFDRVKILAEKDGFSHFRIAEFNGEKPDFIGALNVPMTRAASRKPKN